MDPYVFISYRSDYDAARAGLIHKSITSRLGETAAFMDQTLRPGVAWRDELRAKVAAAAAMIVVIGPNWLHAQGEYGRRRIDLEDDWVRQEIELALAGGIGIVPVLFGHAELPPRAALPDTIAGAGDGPKGLPDYQYVPIRDRFLDNDIQLLISQVERFLAPGKASRERRVMHPYPVPGVNPTPLSDKEIAELLSERLPSWTVAKSPLPQDPGILRYELQRTYNFQSFLGAISFMNLVAPACDIANHHPRWENIFKTIYVSWTTWDIGHKPSKLDVQMAEYFDLAYGRFIDLGGEDRPPVT